MKLIGLALAAGVAFAVYKNDLANKLLNSPALGLASPPPPPPAPAPVAAPAPTPMAQTTTPMSTIDPNTGLPIQTQQPIYPSQPTGIPGVPPPLLSSITGLPVLPSATIAPPVPQGPQYPIGNSPYAPFPFQVSAVAGGPFPGYPYLPPSSLPPGYTIPNINQVQQLPPFQSTMAPPGNRIDFYNPANPPPATTSPTTTGSTTSSVAYAHLGARAYKAGKFGSLRDSAFQVSPLSQEAISNSYRRPGFYAPETLSNI